MNSQIHIRDIRPADHDAWKPLRDGYKWLAGARRVYWQTHATNTAGRALCDKLAEHIGFIAYSRELTGPLARPFQG